MCKKEKCPNFDKCKCGTPKEIIAAAFNNIEIVNQAAYKGSVGKLSDESDNGVVFNLFLGDEGFEGEKGDD